MLNKSDNLSKILFVYVRFLQSNFDIFLYGLDQSLINNKHSKYTGLCKAAQSLGTIYS